MEMNVTNLKLKVKEVETFERPITVYEEYIWNVSKNGMPRGHNSATWIRCVSDVDRIGLKDTFESLDGQMIGKFRITTIRDATTIEIIAWHTLQSKIACISCRIPVCKKCAHHRIPAMCRLSDSLGPAKEILKDKEVIVEVVE